MNGCITDQEGVVASRQDEVTEEPIVAFQEWGSDQRNQIMAAYEREIEAADTQINRFRKGINELPENAQSEAKQTWKALQREQRHLKAEFQEAQEASVATWNQARKELDNAYSAMTQTLKSVKGRWLGE